MKIAAQGAGVKPALLTGILLPLAFSSDLRFLPERGALLHSLQNLFFALVIGRKLKQLIAHKAARSNLAHRIYGERMPLFFL
jgi:hypothetical protein